MSQHQSIYGGIINSTKSRIPKQSQKQDDIRGIINVSEETVQLGHNICLMKDYIKTTWNFQDCLIKKKKKNWIRY